MDTDDAARATPSPAPAPRYEQSRLSAGTRKTIMYVLVAIVLVLGGLLSYGAYRVMGSNDLEATMIRYETIGDDTMRGAVELTRDSPERPAICVVRARDRDGYEVARRELYFPPTEDKTVEITTDYLARGLPAVGDVYGCSYDVPGYIDPETAGPS